MRIDGMDATTRISDYATDKQVTPAPSQASVPETVSKPKVETKQPLEQDVPTDSNERLVRMAIDKANKQMAQRETSLQFEPYDKTGDMIVRIIDTNTKEVIREIPSKKILDMVANMLEMAGLLVDERR